ncbi:thioredoxin domain-containing protein [uncultured Psychroserpens sp.]|uniref:thioredoxin domain-containing protein n=1 Tax=uncultured Psychroserpens sp. TaxID=255436 RepID=UPI00263318D4|nr:thioredoxin domain-containing protein [uncultured Psychroserpens sp.]
MTHRYTNSLINETSPYLLQHAHNPVNWYAWNDDVIKLAKSQNKLIIISVGYSACHWCHVMEDESFENEEVSEIMNTNFINIKVDREERPDIDQVYMNAVQLMTGQGGWPLNVIALPDGRPVWGGTYFRKEQWINALEQIATLFKRDPKKLFEYASKLEEGIKSLDIVSLNTDEAIFETSFISRSITSWSTQFDYTKGGMNKAPKFMMPNNFHFLLRYAYQMNDKQLQNYVNTTLTKIAYGGVFDQIGGGFSRYSVDDKWHVPHFEKMLYDNGQLVSLYSDAYLATKNPLYKNVVKETLDFINRELKGDYGNFYSALDADSKNHRGKLEEGAYYVWQKDTLKTLLKEDYMLFSDYYNINSYGYWEHNNYVLIRKDDDASIIKKHKITQNILNNKKSNWKALLIEHREKRIKPRLDDKSLTSWNAIMLKGYIDAYRVFKNEIYLNTAIENANFIIENQIRDDSGLNHNFKNGKSNINGYLEDYANTISAFLALYENTLDEKWLLLSRDLANYTLDHFLDDSSNMFYFTSNEDTSLVSRSIEYRDNVIPASNSVMAKNLFLLSHHFNNNHFFNIARAQLNNIKSEIIAYTSGYSNWLDLMLNFTQPFYEIVIIGNDAKEKLSELNTIYHPNHLIAGSFRESDLPLLKGRFAKHNTRIYVCVNNSCLLPTNDINDVVNKI